MVVRRVYLVRFLVYHLKLDHVRGRVQQRTGDAAEPVGFVLVPGEPETSQGGRIAIICLDSETDGNPPSSSSLRDSSTD